MRGTELVERLFRTQSGRLVAHFARRFGVRHIDLAEEVVQDALVKALQQWPYTGVPKNPEGWLFRVACHGAIDVLRRRAAFVARAADVAREIEREARSASHFQGSTGSLDDDELRMVLMCCHPSLPRDARVALSLRTVGGLAVAEIARALLSDERTIAQRLVRAKRRIRELSLTFDLPSGRALHPRVDSALDVIYLVFTEGHGAHAEGDLIRADLCREALRLGQLIAGTPAVATPRAHALVALMALHAARLPARLDEHGEMVLLEDQDRSLWNQDLVTLGFQELDRSIDGPKTSTYHVQAAIAATHAAAPDARSVDWRAILGLYDELMEIDPSPVARLNRAVAVAKVRGPAAGLAEIAPLEREPALRRYALLPAVRADLLARAGRYAAARQAYRAALRLPCSAPERRFLESRLAGLSRRIA
jgi:RNA polymerase sigma-70 factor (ECF subfamily)